MNEEKNEGLRSKKKNGTPTVSRVLSNGVLVELVYNPEARATALVVWQDSQWTINGHLDTPEGERLIPFSPDNNLIRNEAVLLPSEPTEYGDGQELVSGIRQFIHRYCDLSPSFETIASYYVLLTWVHDAFNELPYLRLRGDFGTGKTSITVALSKGF